MGDDEAHIDEATKSAADVEHEREREQRAQDGAERPASEDGLGVGREQAEAGGDDEDGDVDA